MSVAIKANKNDFAETVVMPGDPLRAKYIAEHYLEDAIEVNTVRNMLGYTGYYKGKRVSVMGHGMGIPSVTLYATELIKDYGVKNLIRIGTCGSVNDDINLMNVLIGMGACTDSSTNRMRFEGYDFAPIADFSLLEKSVHCARQSELDFKVGNIFTSDLFYSVNPNSFETMNKYGIIGVDMEVSGLYAVAAEFGVKALALLTVTDHITKGQALSIEEREATFNQMISLGLDTAVSV